MSNLGLTGNILVIFGCFALAAVLFTALRRSSARRRREASGDGGGGSEGAAGARALRPAETAIMMAKVMGEGAMVVTAAIEGQSQGRMIGRRVFLGLCGALVAGPALGQGVNMRKALLEADSLWNHNGSTMRLLAQDGFRVMLYEVPRPGLIGTVRPGQVLFRGERRGDVLVGEAFTFKAGCEPAPYDVVARVRDETFIVFEGAAPLRGGGCTIRGYGTNSPHAVLVFEYIRINQ